MPQDEEVAMDTTAAFRRIAEAGPGRMVEPLAAYQDLEAPTGAMLHSAGPVDGPLAVKVTRGTGNHVFRGWKGSAKGASISFAGNRNVVFVGPHARFSGADVRVTGDDSLFLFGAFSTVESMIVMLSGPAGRISIGEHCMLSARIIMDRSDHHTIYDVATGMRINDDRDVFIDDHVWISREVRIGKGVNIGRDAVVGQGSIVVGILEPGTLNVGVPARTIRQGVTWSRMKAASLPEMEASQRHLQYLAKVDELRLRIARLGNDSEAASTGA
jgi:acetyltransferase-like isoleucine patch superfamily enzyme